MFCVISKATKMDGTGTEKTSLIYTYGILLGFLIVLYLFLQGSFF